MHAIGTDPTSATCQVTIKLFIRQIFNKEIKEQVMEAKNTLTLRHDMTLPQEAGMKLKIWGSIWWWPKSNAN